MQGMHLAFLCCMKTASEAAARAEEAAQRAVAALETAREVNHYAVLGLPCDFTAEELRRAYRSLSLQHHPDRGGSAAAFARVAEAHDCLLDARCRLRFESGEGLETLERFNSIRSHRQSISFSEIVERQYYPEHFPFEPFGDVFDRAPDHIRERAAARRERRQAPRAKYSEEDHIKQPEGAACTDSDTNEFVI